MHKSKNYLNWPTATILVDARIRTTCSLARQTEILVIYKKLAKDDT